MRLIDANALKKAMQGLLILQPPQRNAIFLTPDQFIDAAPTIDAAPVVHAKWDVESTKHGDRLCCCRCGFCGDGTGENYCPYCGAKMDLEEEKP